MAFFFSHLKRSVIAALPKHVNERYDPMQVPGQSVLSSGFSVVVVVVVGGGVGRKNGGRLMTSFLGGAF
jgi:hypothetical protein